MVGYLYPAPPAMEVGIMTLMVHPLVAVATVVVRNASVGLRPSAVTESLLITFLSE